MRSPVRTNFQQFILASQSPRRRQLLEQAGYDIHTIPSKVSEIPKENLNLRERICDLAWQKVQSLVGDDKLPKSGPNLVLAADTVVVLDGQLLGKPKTPAEAQETLRQLSGRDHQVITGIVLYQPETTERIDWAETTDIVFHKLTDEMINEYVKSGDPMDKAGSYGIQNIGEKFVKETKGSFSNVVGLPMEKLEELVLDNDWQLPRK